MAKKDIVGGSRIGLKVESEVKGPFGTRSFSNLSILLLIG